MQHTKPTTSGTRDELMSQLKNMAEGWDHLGKPKQAAAAVAAFIELESGASSVQAGHTTYIVTD
jgi:hypothetical protein